jgi:predicted tellurium resistance membrane protein TerC
MRSAFSRRSAALQWRRFENVAIIETLYDKPMECHLGVMGRNPAIMAVPPSYVTPMQYLLNTEVWAAFLTLASLEIVLGVDNIIFLSISASRLPPQQQPRARTLGLAAAMLTRILLLLSLAFLARLTAPWITVLGRELSGRDLILLLGGMFLMGKATLEIHEQLEGATREEQPVARYASFGGVILQIMVVDVVFSLDSVITAVGMTRNIPVMIAAIVAAVGVMMFAAGAVSRFVDEHPTIRTLALAFLILIGMSLVAESFAFHVPKGYIYFSMAFAGGVELINTRLAKLRARRRSSGSK